MKLFAKTEESTTKCKKCGLELHDEERLRRHEKVAHGRKIDAKCRNCGAGSVSYTHLTLPTILLV